MEGGVKFIFKTLFKVPIYIYIAFLIFNIFAFCFVYFKMLGLSYMVQQIAVENNYIPTNQRDSLGEYISKIDESIAMVSDVSVITSTDDGATYVPGIISNPTVAKGYEYETNLLGANSAFVSDKNKHQYGQQVIVGVECVYNWVWPFDYRDAKRGTGSYSGYKMANGQYIGGYDAKTESRINPHSGDKMVDELTLSQNKITIVYDVPGLKYYPDIT